MDTEKLVEIEEKVKKGKPVTDEGPYYHHAWWESYKGMVKGKLGGAVIGAIMGSVVGVAAAAVLSTIGAPIAAGVVIAAFAGAGMIKGVHEFSQIGASAGAVAAGLDTAERRNKLYLDGKFNEIEAKLDRLEAEIPNKTPAPVIRKEVREPVYRTDHFVEAPDGKGQAGLVFWKVAAIGLAVGAAAGLLLAGSGVAAMALEHVLGHGIVAGLGTSGITALSTATFAAFGASFGINRDVFRKIFDHTDVLARGMTRRLGLTESQKVQAPAQEQEQAPQQNSKQTVIYEPQINYPESNTYHRDKVIAQAKQALLGMDHTKLPPH